MATRSKSNQSADKSANGHGTKPYTVLARRYRSRGFDEIVGQEPIARTLQNAINSNRTAHAYLFCGTRGVGKTSMARIFAKALNATDDLQEKDAVADAILRGDDLDVIEIDAASNRGIDNARELIANAGLSPARSPYKIYIIDEVHQLTKEAFNALLKTMEEPPAHVKFILCTTEPQKVPATIQSRCQRFDFRAIPSSKIAEQIRHILKEEGLQANDEVIAQVARLGQGSMRDALSVLDRLLAGGENTLTKELLEQMLGLPDQALVTELVDAIIDADARAALDRGSQLLARGASIEQALEMLTDHLRTLMVIAACGADNEILDLSDESLRTATTQAANFDAPGLVHMIAICDSIARNARTSAAARALFDAAIVRLALSERFSDISGLLNRNASPIGKRMTPDFDGGSKKKEPSLISHSQSRDAVDLPSSRELQEQLPAGHADSADEMRVLRSSSTGSPALSGDQPGATLEIKPVADDQIWPRVLQLAAESMGDRQRTEHLVYESFDGRTLRLSIDEGGADIARYLNTQIDRLIELVKRATGRTVRIELESSRFHNSARQHATAANLQESQRPPLVQMALELFDAAVVSIEDITPDSLPSPNAEEPEPIA